MTLTSGQMEMVGKYHFVDLTNFLISPEGEVRSFYFFMMYVPRLLGKTSLTSVGRLGQTLVWCRTQYSIQHPVGGM